MAKLVLFTIEFPFGNQEQFIDNELPYLSKGFDEIHILPAKEGECTVARNLPENVFVSRIRFSKINRPGILELVKTSKLWLPIYLETLLVSKYRNRYLQYYKSFIHHAWNDLRNFYQVKEFIKTKRIADAVFYDYWFVNATLTLSLLKKQDIISKFYARAHGFDLYDERQNEGVLSYREFKLKYVNKLFPVSKYGCNYLKSKSKNVFHSKIKTFYLGTEGFSINQNQEYLEGKHTVVSVSSMSHVKRVQDIVQGLHASGKKIHWIHFGDGDEFEDVKKLALNKSDDNFSFELRGHVENTKILEFYSQYKVSFLINLSKYEGIPVSFMEAISAGIPILAPAIYGIPEIVQNGTGYLIQDPLNLSEIIEGINSILSTPVHQQEIINFWNLKFNASKNYSDFVAYVLNDRD